MPQLQLNSFWADAREKEKAGPGERKHIDRECKKAPDKVDEEIGVPEKG